MISGRFDVFVPIAFHPLSVSLSLCCCGCKNGTWRFYELSPPPKVSNNVEWVTVACVCAYKRVIFAIIFMLVGRQIIIMRLINQWFQQIWEWTMGGKLHIFIPTFILSLSVCGERLNFGYRYISKSSTLLAKLWLWLSAIATFSIFVKGVTSHLALCFWSKSKPRGGRNPPFSTCLLLSLSLFIMSPL